MKKALILSDENAKATREFHILNLGAGVQSTALYLMSMQGEAPHFDRAIFADTGEEPQAVYRHLEWLQSLAGPEILVRSVGSRLGDDLIAGRNSRGRLFASIPAFTIIEGGKRGIIRRQCSTEYKIEVIERAIRRDVLGLQPRRTIPKGTTVHQYFGISFDEGGRARRLLDRFRHGSTRFQPHFPLVDRMITRANCLEYLKDKVPHAVPRSACVFCPYHNDQEWLRLQTAAGPDWDRAVEIDRALRTSGSVANRDMRQTMYLHSSCQPLEEVEFKPRTNIKEMQLGFNLECEGVCGV